MSEHAFNIPAALYAMKRAGFSYAKTADALELSRQAVGHWFRGRGEPSLKQIKAIARLWGCNVAELIDDDAVIANTKATQHIVRVLQELPPEAEEEARQHADWLRQKYGPSA